MLVVDEFGLVDNCLKHANINKGERELILIFNWGLQRTIYLIFVKKMDTFAHD
jgi:hypothetical protein